MKSGHVELGLAAGEAGGRSPASAGVAASAFRVAFSHHLPRHPGESSQGHFSAIDQSSRDTVQSAPDHV